MEERGRFKPKELVPPERPVSPLVDEKGAPFTSNPDYCFPFDGVAYTKATLLKHSGDHKNCAPCRARVIYDKELSS